MFKFCQYVFQSYNESLDQADISENFDEIIKGVIKINTRTPVFDQDLLIHVLWYLKITKTNFEGNPSINQINKNEEISNLATALLKHSKKLAHKN